MSYYSVRIHPEYQKYFKFAFNGQLYQYTAFPNGLASCPRNFTKLLKPPLSLLRSQGHIVSSYIDDLYIQNDTYNGCLISVLSTLQVFDDLGFVAHPEKSEFLPKQQLTFLGFRIASVLMRVSLTPERLAKVITIFEFIRSNASKLTFRHTARALGYMVSRLPAVPYGGLSLSLI